MQLDRLAMISDDLSATAARSAKVAQLASLLSATESKADAMLAVSWLSGELTQRQLGVGWASLRELPAAASKSSLSLSAVEALFERIEATTGAGSQALRRDLVRGIFMAATASEQVFLRRVITGELRQGALAGVMTEAVAKAAGATPATIRRAVMLSGNLAAVAATALHDGAAALASYTLQPGRPIGSMLAQTAASTDAALRTLGTAGLEWKLDGVRVQIHRSDKGVSIFTRSLGEITERLPDVVAAVQALPAESLIADGEVIALHENGRPKPFQVTAARLASHKSSDVPLTTYIFDLLHSDGNDLLDEPAERRRQALERVIPANGPIQSTPRLVTDDPEQAAAFLKQALDHGHEGILAKSLDAPYQAGRRGAAWLKVKPVHTLDLVVLAVEWGSGRRTGRLSNIHLGARDPATGGHIMLGKTFKGLSDVLLAWQTERFLELADGPTDGYVVRVRPEQVVEIAFDGVQRSSRYPGGVALRFARVLRYREDKRPEEADTIDTVRAFYFG